MAKKNKYPNGFQIVTKIQIEKDIKSYGDRGMEGMSKSEAKRFAKESAVERFEENYPNVRFKIKKQLVEVL